MFQVFKTSTINHQPLSSDDASNFNPKRSTFFSIFTLYPRSTLLVLLLIVQVLLLSFYFDHFPFVSLTQFTPNTNLNQCEFGRFYAYNLPPSFNKEFLKHCKNLSPWGSLCGTLSNDGLGQNVTGIEKIIPAHLVHTWYGTDQFSLEVMFHTRMLNHKCRTMDPESATAFYIPFYSGIAVRKALMRQNDFLGRDMPGKMMLDWIQTQQPYFNRSKGLDHFLVIGRITWEFRRANNSNKAGSSFLNMQRMKYITRLMIERLPKDSFDIGVPYPTGFHPETDSDVVAWQKYVKSRERHALFAYVGGKRPTRYDIRSKLLSQCNNSGESCRHVDCNAGECNIRRTNTLETFLDSDFCLQPKGDSFTRKSIFDCLVAGSIPVFFWKESAYVQYQWFLTGEPESYSVYIHHGEVFKGKSIKGVLESFSKEEVKKMRDKVVEFIPKIIYVKPKEGLQKTRDAVDVAVDGVMKRIKMMQQKGNISIN